MSASTILTQIDNAIASILTNGQEVVVNGQRYTKANLEQLRKLRADFAAMVNVDNRPSILDRALAGTVKRY